jgi:trehalose-6-phosphatase
MPERERNAADRPPSEWALFLDFDGTLVEIVERPEAVVVDPALPHVLKRLEERLGGALALISGRPIAFLDERLAPLTFDAAGLHGIEHRIAGRLTSCRPEDYPALRAAVGRLHETLGPRQGIIIEDKGCSVAIHWRLAPHAADFARAGSATGASSWMRCHPTRCAGWYASVWKPTWNPEYLRRLKLAEQGNDAGCEGYKTY